MRIETVFRLVDELRRNIEWGEAREGLMLGSILTGRQVFLFGQRAKITLEWPDGLPSGMTEEDLRQIGEDAYRKAGG